MAPASCPAVNSPSAAARNPAVATAGFLAAADGEFTAGQLAGAIAGLLELDGDGERHLLLAVADLLRDGFLIHCDAGHA